MNCFYCGAKGVHPGTKRCSDSTACDLRVATARITQLEAELSRCHLSAQAMAVEAVKDEREACAALCESIAKRPDLTTPNGPMLWCAAAIRARGAK